ncbi:hypothetical protein [Bacillus paranthracis]|uniref:Uncharacterized protein n=1 Tax=Bacillus paranthracis TaxID=2026186 RepID=A0AAJ1NKG8_9BACI|nr:hypothetical protein [Bacillus paranthracis]MDG0949997.1 hypothetical protein [Bacillus paranthracis]MDG0955894.1 hypothetical protein [Bacillus paranthracis]
MDKEEKLKEIIEEFIKNTGLPRKEVIEFIINQLKYETKFQRR